VSIPKRFRPLFKKTYFIGLVALPIVLVLLPVDFFDEGQTLCISVFLLDLECYACGMTRAIHHLIHLEFNEAFEFNRLSFIVLPLLIYVWLTEIIKLFKFSRSKKSNPVK
jgi:uncharacterized integral membrane protein